jgi:hypothetical protein
MPGQALPASLMVFLAPHAWQSFFPLLPGIPPAMMDSASIRLAEDGWWAVVVAPIAGIPYRLYTAEAAIQGLPWWQLVLVTPFARGWRFLLAGVCAFALGMFLRWHRIGAPIMGWPWAFVALHFFFWVVV